MAARRWRSATRLGDGGGEPLRVVGRNADAGPRLGEDARDRRSRGRWQRARAARRRGSSTSSTARSRGRGRGAAGTTWRSPVASSSPRRSAGTKLPNRTLARPGPDFATRSPRVEPSPLITNVTCGSCRAAATTSSSDCENPMLPAYNTTGSSPIPSSCTYAGHPVAGAGSPSVSTKLGIIRTLSRWRGSEAWRRRWRRGRRTAPSRRRPGGS